LRDVASWLFSHDHAQQRLDDEVTAGFRASVAVGEHGSIVDALDFVATAPVTHRQLSEFSDEGLVRLRRLGSQLAFLRGRTGLDLVDLVTLVEHEMLLDVEVAAATGAPSGGAWLQAFEDELAGYVATDENAGLGGFLSWLAAAERRDDMGPRSEQAERGTVQLLTIHGSKGLEWDVVAVPRLVEGELPGTSREGVGWLGFGELPYEFRGDAAELPVLGWRGVADQKEFDQSLKAFKDELVVRHQAEERRLAYVALTRARDALLVSGSFWTSAVRPRPASRFVVELAEKGLVPTGDLPERPDDDENPLAAASRELSWPLDPLGQRRAVVEDAAARVAVAVPCRRARRASAGRRPRRPVPQRPRRQPGADPGGRAAN
jgi:DNA helicase-2/ATP-dependent DNA helicase PcrA